MGDRCRSCDAPIEWAITTKGQRIPLDPEPGPGGNLVLVDGVARHPTLGEGVPYLQYTSHFATCPDAERFRRKGKVRR
jgi:hypothetical protein